MEKITFDAKSFASQIFNLNKVVPKNRASDFITIWLEKGNLYGYIDGVASYGFTKGTPVQGWKDSPAFSLPREILLKAMRILAAGDVPDVTFVFDDGKIIIKDSSGSVMSLNVVLPKEKPTTKLPEMEVFFKFQPGELSAVTDGVEKDRGLAAARPVFGAVAVKAEAGSDLLRLYATCGTYLAAKTVTGGDTAKKDAVYLTQPLPYGAGGTIGFNQKNTILITDEATMVFANIEGSAPNYDAVINKDFASKAEINTNELQMALEKLSIVTDFLPAPVEAFFGDTELTLVVSSAGLDEKAAEIGKIKAVIPMKMLQGSASGCKAAYNAVNLQKVVKAGKDGDIRMSLMTPDITLSPVRFDCEDGTAILATPVRKKSWTEI